MNTIFEKAIERDGTFVTQQFFARNLTHDLATDYGIDCPHRPVVLHFANKENIQLFENKQALHWIQDKLLEKNLESESFMSQILDEHLSLLPRIEELWQEVALNDRQFEEYKRLVRRATLNISIYYYAGIDERTPEPIRNMIIEIRKTDEFGARNDEFVRTSVASHGLDGELARVLLLSELLEPNQKVLEERISGAWLIDGELQVAGFKEFISAHRGYHFKDSLAGSDASFVQGQVAQKGLVNGRVKIVKNRQQAGEVSEGEIIVSPMTQPDFIQAMHKAAAFVTDEGGVVCHAAVIAREMKKPCITGTKVATQVFKDGDMVEVDAEKGIVRKIEV